MKFLFTLLTLCMVLTLKAQTPAEVAAKYNEAAELVNGKKFAEAVPVLQQTVEMGLSAGPDAIQTVNDAQKLLPMCNFRKAMGLAQAGDLEGALVDLQTALEQGELYGDMSTMTNAKAMISKIYTMMGGKAFNSEDYASAAEIFAKGFAANPSDTALGLNLAKSYCELGVAGDEEAKAKGLDVYKSIIELGTKHSKYEDAATTANDMVSYYLMLDAADAAKAGDNDKVFTVIDQILEIAPNNPTAMMMRIQTATNMKNWDMVIENGDATAEVQTTPELQSNAYFLLGAAYQNKENKAKAIETYQKVTEGANVDTAKAQIALLNK